MAPNPFAYNDKPTPEMVEAMNELRAKLADVYDRAVALAPGGPDLALGLRKLQEAGFWINHSIAQPGPGHAPKPEPAPVVLPIPAPDDNELTPQLADAAPFLDPSAPEVMAFIRQHGGVYRSAHYPGVHLVPRPVPLAE